MKKVVRLNENDIEKLVRKIILENEDPTKEEGKEIFELIKNGEIKPTGSEGIFRFEYGDYEFVIYPDLASENSRTILLGLTKKYVFKKFKKNSNDKGQELSTKYAKEIYNYLDKNPKKSVMIGENKDNQSEEKLLKTNNGALSAIDALIKSVSDAKDAYTELCNSKITGSNSHLDSIDGLATKFTSLISSLEKSKVKIGKFVQQKSEQDNMAYMKQKQMDHMRKRKEAYMSGKNYSY